MALLGLLAATLPRAGATAEAELCVTCAGPSAVYRCVIELPATTKSADARAQMLCATELATSGGHQSCSVARVSAAPCDGPVRTVKGPAAAVPPMRETLTQASGADASVAAREALLQKENAAEVAAPEEAKADAPAKSTWRCVASLFKDC
jgi:hypothetical protein